MAQGGKGKYFKDNVMAASTHATEVGQGGRMNLTESPCLMSVDFSVRKPTCSLVFTTSRGHVSEAPTVPPTLKKFQR